MPTPLRVVVLGGRGALGRRVVDLLAEQGHDVAAASRASGADAYTGRGLAEAFAGADTVVDCLNISTLRRRTAVDFFATSAMQVSGAAGRAGVRHLVCLSIVNAARPEVAAALGYYAGKAAQEAAYRSASVPMTLARTTQWFELAESMLGQIRLGPLAVVPRMRSQPVAADAAAAFVVDLVEHGDGQRIAELAGPEVHDLAELARRIAAVTPSAPRVLGVPAPGALGSGGLLPRGDHLTDRTTFDAWLAARG